MAFNISAAQLLFIVCGIWAVLLLWPQAAMHFSSTLSRHACALSGLYTHLRRGLRCYASRFQTPDKRFKEII
jgi:hypothetical protein